MKHRCGLLVLLVREFLLDDLSFKVLLAFKNHPIDATLLKYHLIEGERTSFISEYKFNLAHLLNEIGVSADCEAEFFIVNTYIFPYDIGLAQLHNF